jgi:hypothetical protein
MSLPISWDVNSTGQREGMETNIPATNRLSGRNAGPQGHQGKRRDRAAAAARALMDRRPDLYGINGLADALAESTSWTT